MDGLRRWFVAGFLVRDVRKTIGALNVASGPFRSTIAKRLADRIDNAVLRLREAREIDRPTERTLWSEMLEEAKIRRHVALQLGASSHADPYWAEAALEESWLMAASGNFGNKGVEVQRQIDAFLSEAIGAE